MEAFQKERNAQLKTSSSSVPIQASNTATAAAAAAAATEECQAGVTKKEIHAHPDLEIHKKLSLELIVDKLQSDIRDMKIIHSEYESASTTAIDTLSSSKGR